MFDGTLLLGPVLFQDFEVPDKITFGGEQRLAIHRLPGGARIIDALGRDDGEITWSGIFSGEDAGLRARLVDTLRAGGGVLPLTWDAFFYSVVIARFEADFTRENWIPYKISCTVLRDEAATAIDTVLSLADSAVADLAAAAGFTLPVDLTATTAALAVSGATTAGTASYAAARSSLTATGATLNASVSQGEAILLAASDPGVAADAAGSLAQLANARCYVQRAATNLANASS